MHPMTINFSELEDFDPSDSRVKRKDKVIMPKPHHDSGPEQAILQAGIGAYSMTDLPWAGVLGDSLGFSGKTRRVALVGTTKLKHMTVATPHSDTTVTLGPSASAGAVVTLGISGGLFFSNVRPIIGLYGSVDLGLVTDITASIVLQCMVLLKSPTAAFKGPPTVLVGVNVGGKVLAASGFLVCHDIPGRPLNVIGVGYSLGVGASLLPASVFLSKSYGVSTV